MFSRFTRYRNPNAGTPVTSTPEPTFSVTTIINSSTVTYNINTNLTQEQTLYYTLVGAESDDFSSGGNVGSVAVNSFGSATVTRNCNVYNDIGNVTTFQFQLRSGGLDGQLVATGDNVTIQSQTNITATGGNVSYIAGFKLHTFDSPGNTTFTLSSLGNYGWALTDYFSTLIVGGGGSGGTISGNTYAAAGGGGGGGFYQANTVVNNMGLGTYTVSVGSGGTTTSDVFNNAPAFGGNSSFGSNVVTGGAPGGSSYPSTGSSTGSNSRTGGVDRGAGGGAGATIYDTPNVTISGGTGTANGGAGRRSASGAFGTFVGGGGGGANTAGTTGTISGSTIVPGPGGNGLISAITGNNVVYAGGGAGSGRWLSNSTVIAAAGGTGGGGDTNVAGTDGLGGGGGANALGGDGVVMVRYPDVGSFRFFT